MYDQYISLHRNYKVNEFGFKYIERKEFKEKYEAFLDRFSWRDKYHLFKRLDNCGFNDGKMIDSIPLALLDVFESCCFVENGTVNYVMNAYSATQDIHEMYLVNRSFSSIIKCCNEVQLAAEYSLDKMKLKELNDMTINETDQEEYIYALYDYYTQLRSKTFDLFKRNSKINFDGKIQFTFTVRTRFQAAKLFFNITVLDSITNELWQQVLNAGDCFKNIVEKLIENFYVDNYLSTFVSSLVLFNQSKSRSSIGINKKLKDAFLNKLKE